MKKTHYLLLIVLLAFFNTCFAISLQDAKSQGLVGETPNGYLAIASSQKTAELQTLVVEVNSKRKAKYQAIAGKVGKTLKMVESLAGKKAISKTKAGNLIQKADGSWVSK